MAVDATRAGDLLESGCEMMTIAQMTLAGYCPSEQRAIRVHKYYLGIDWGRDPSITEAIDSWENQYAPEWRARKMRCDATEQLRQIEVHQARLERESGSNVSLNDAARDWVANYEPAWRERWEQCDQAGA